MGECGSVLSSAPECCGMRGLLQFDFVAFQKSDRPNLRGNGNRMGPAAELRRNPINQHQQRQSDESNVVSAILAGNAVAISRQTCCEMSGCDEERLVSHLPAH